MDNNLLEYIIKVLKKYKFNNLLIDNEIIYNFWDDYLCNPFVDSLMAEQRFWDISIRPFFYKDDFCYNIFLYMQYLFVKYIFYPLVKILVFFIKFIKMKYLFIANKILHSTLFVSLFGPLKIFHFEMVLRIWFVFSSVVIILLWLLCIYVLYLMFKYVNRKSKEVFLDLFYLYLDLTVLLPHYFLIICFLVFDLIFLAFILPFQKYPKLRRLYRFLFKVVLVSLIIIPIYLFIYFKLLGGL